MGHSGYLAFRVAIMRRFTCSTGQGYDDVEWAISRSSSPITAIAASISVIVDIPVDRIIGRPVALIFLSRSWSVSDADATLWHGGSGPSLEATPSSSPHAGKPKKCLFPQGGSAGRCS